MKPISQNRNKFKILGINQRPPALLVVADFAIFAALREILSLFSSGILKGYSSGAAISPLILN